MLKKVIKKVSQVSGNSIGVSLTKLDKEILDVKKGSMVEVIKLEENKK